MSRKKTAVPFEHPPGLALSDLDGDSAPQPRSARVQGHREEALQSSKLQTLQRHDLTISRLFEESVPGMKQ